MCDTRSRSMSHHYAKLVRQPQSGHGLEIKESGPELETTALPRSNVVFPLQTVYCTILYSGLFFVSVWFLFKTSDSTAILHYSISQLRILILHPWSRERSPFRSRVNHNARVAKGLRGRSSRQRPKAVKRGFGLCQSFPSSVYRIVCLSASFVCSSVCSFASMFVCQCPSVRKAVRLPSFHLSVNSFVFPVCP